MNGNGISENGDIRTIYLVTGGGHISSFHPALTEIVKAATVNGIEVKGIVTGWRGINNAENRILTPKDFEWWENRAGSVIGCSREKTTLDKLLTAIPELKTGRAGMIVLGGEDTLSVANQMSQEYFKRSGQKLPIVGWPKTMDNDLSGTHFTLGYPTAVKVGAKRVLDAFNNVYTNNGVHFLVAFGRNTDWVVAGLAHYGYADLVIGSEHQYTLQEVIGKVQEAYDRNKARYGRSFAVVVVSEGVKINGLEKYMPKINGEKVEIDAFGHEKLKPKKTALALEEAFKKKTKIKPWSETLEYELRDKSPINVDVRIGRKCAIYVYGMLIDGYYDNMVAIQIDGSDQISFSQIPLEEAVKVRYAKPEGMIDYAAMQVTPRFIKYAQLFLSQRVSVGKARPPVVRDLVPA